MIDQTAQHDVLRSIAAELLSNVEQQSTAIECRHAELAALIREAEAAELRRAAYKLRDGKCYELGAAFEPPGALDTDPLAVTGFLALDATAVLLLARLALEKPDQSVAELLARLFRSSAGQQIRALGVWVRWNWLKELYQDECERYHALFRRNGERRVGASKPTTRRQRYMVEQICAFLQMVQPDIADRGAAYEWIKKHGGNPRFQEGPRRPSMAGLAEAFS